MSMAAAQFLGIDYSFQPGSYWTKPKGRRTKAKKPNDGSTAPGLEDSFLPIASSMDAMFGADKGLPKCVDGEVEIAWIHLDSGTPDAISIRARQVVGGIRYRVVDEYGGKFKVSPQSSQGPLTMLQLVHLIDGIRHSGLTRPFSLAYNELNAEFAEDRSELRHFTRIGSDCYPELEAHFEKVFEAWVQEGTKSNGSVG